ncbi:hypothetical protein [Candidatus Cytomitobacter primus]|uniref:Uncharacterized protein n=1 Tax=Candidatus Cytomitobacter primus TaxID=2066024 RepID=A0A5C0UGK6_9PROT|nr:hypothetical protein [Candidatus Cytomitobacter primus]QEK38801.1 hypothetical protein FZC34_02720 [Candidatus Cytomitobacter primus]
MKPLLYLFIFNFVYGDMKDLQEAIDLFENKSSIVEFTKRNLKEYCQLLSEERKLVNSSQNSRKTTLLSALSKNQSLKREDLSADQVKKKNKEIINFGNIMRDKFIRVLNNKEVEHDFTLIDCIQMLQEACCPNQPLCIEYIKEVVLTNSLLRPDCMSLEEDLMPEYILSESYYKNIVKLAKKSENVIYIHHKDYEIAFANLRSIKGEIGEEVYNLAKRIIWKHCNVKHRKLLTRYRNIKYDKKIEESKIKNQSKAG